MCDICSKWLGDVLYPQVQSFFWFINFGIFAAMFHDVDHGLRFGTHDSNADSQYEPTVDHGMLSRALEKYDAAMGSLRAQQRVTASTLAPLQAQYLTDTRAAASRSNAVDAQVRESAGAQVLGTAKGSWPHGPQNGSCAASSSEV